MADLPPGAVRLSGVSRRFKLVHEKNTTLKEALLRRRRSSYTELWALRDCDLDIVPGEAVGLIGRNGSGKSTTLKLVAGILPPHDGSVEVGGRIASLLELGAGFHPDFTGRENVYMNGAIHGFSEKEITDRMDEIVGFAELEEFIDMPVRSYSSGMFMRLAFSVAIHVDADVLLLDEVLAVGDEAFQRKCFGRIFAFLRGGGTLVFVSHDPSAIERVCTRAVLLDEGRVVFDGDPTETLNLYHRLLAEQESGDDAAGTKVESGDGNHWGSGRVTIEHAEMIGPSGPTFRVASGDDIELRLQVRSNGGPVANPAFGMGIYDIDGQQCFGTNTILDSATTGVLDGESEVRFRIRDLPLHEGRFYLHLSAVAGDQSEIYHWIERVFEFTVFPQSPGVGMVRMDGEWAFDERLAPERSALGAAADGDGHGAA